jgi:hypothetical protein
MLFKFDVNDANKLIIYVYRSTVWTGILIYRYWDAFEILRQNSRRLFVTIYVRMVLCVFVSVTGLMCGSLLYKYC